LGTGPIQADVQAVQTTDLLEDLQASFARSFDAISLKAELRRTLDIFGQRPGPVIDELVAGYLTDRLRAIAAGRGLHGVIRPTVLFVCVHNSGRSQMAASLLKRQAPNVTVLSAGSRPTPTVNPVVVEAMAELGIDVSAAAPARARDRAAGGPRDHDGVR
jgi:hypothetical protein